MLQRAEPIRSPTSSYFGMDELPRPVLLASSSCAHAHSAAQSSVGGTGQSRVTSGGFTAMAERGSDRQQTRKNTVTTPMAQKRSLQPMPPRQTSRLVRHQAPVVSNA
jgi:hypothetical protein